MSLVRKIKKGDKICLAEVENKRIKSKVIQKHIRYMGKEVNNKKVISLNSEDFKFLKLKSMDPLLF